MEKPNIEDLIKIRSNNADRLDKEFERITNLWFASLCESGLTIEEVLLRLKWNEIAHDKLQSLFEELMTLKDTTRENKEEPRK